MRRRGFITLVGGAAAWPLAVRAQQAGMPVVGFLSPGLASTSRFQADALRRGLAETSYVEGRNVAIEYRWAEGRHDRLPELAADLVQSRVKVIAACGTSAPGLAAKAATSTIPIVFQTGGDPVADGLVASMNRPGRNVTGVSRLNVALGPKRLELLHEAVPKATVIACLIDPTSSRDQSEAKQLQDSARSLGLELAIVNANTERDLDGAFATIVKAGATALLIVANTVNQIFRDQIILWAVRHALPTMFSDRTSVAIGGLMSYDSSITDTYRQAGVYVGRILKGEQPGDLPILQPTKFELVINLKVAKVLGLTIPESFLLRADEVIE